MNASLAKNKQGFTIIEVVLVLAIAALIFLMVFIALPALQRNQRDTARKNVASKVASAVTSFQSNNRGNNPTTAAQIRAYADNNGTDVAAVGAVPAYGVVDQEYGVTVEVYPTGAGAPANIAPTPWNTQFGADQVQRIRVVTRATCDANGQNAVTGNRRQVAVLIGLENGNAPLCQNV